MCKRRGHSIFQKGGKYIAQLYIGKNENGKLVYDCWYAIPIMIETGLHVGEILALRRRRMHMDGELRNLGYKLQTGYFSPCDFTSLRQRDSIISEFSSLSWLNSPSSSFCTWGFSTSSAKNSAGVIPR